MVLGGAAWTESKFGRVMSLVFIALKFRTMGARRMNGAARRMGTQNNSNNKAYPAFFRVSIHARFLSTGDQILNQRWTSTDDTRFGTRKRAGKGDYTMNIYHSYPKTGKSSRKINRNANCLKCKLSRQFTADSLVCDAKDYHPKGLTCFVPKDAEQAGEVKQK